MLNKLVDLNFKTVDGVTRFFKFGVGSKGVVVDDIQIVGLRAQLRSMYRWWVLPMIIGGIGVGPILPVLFLPAMFASYYLSTTDILHTTSEPDRISPIESYRRFSLIVPSWLLWISVLFSGAFVVSGCYWFISEGLAIRRAERLGQFYDDSILEAAFCVIFFSLCMSVLYGQIKTKKRHKTPVQPSTTKTEPHFG